MAKIKNWGSFKTTPTGSGKLFMVSWNQVEYLYHDTSERVFSRDEAIAIQDSIKGEFEGSNVCSFTKDKLNAFLKQTGCVVSQYYGSTVDRVEYVKIMQKPSLPLAVKTKLIGADVLLEHPFEVMNFQGNTQDTFAYIASRILGSALQRKVILSVPHQNMCEYSPRGAFQIYVWSTPHRGSSASTRPPFKLWGIEVSCRDRAFQPSSGHSEGSILITDGDYVVAELLENALYIHHDMVQHGSTSEYKLFAKLLTKAAELLLGKDEFATAIAESQKRFSVQQQKAFDNFVKKGIPKRARRKDTEIDDVRKSVQSALQTYFEAKKALFSLEQSVNDPNIAGRKFMEEFSHLQEGGLDGVLSVIIDGNDEETVVVVHTKELTAFNRRTEKTHLLGHLVISFNLDSGKVHFHNLDRTLKGFDGKQQPAPHVFCNGSPCWGNIDSELCAYIAHYELEAAISLTLAFLQTGVNDEDPLGRVINHFPEVSQTDK